MIENLQSMACMTSIYLVGLMHPEPRPFGDSCFLHNHIRTKCYLEDSRANWYQDTTLFGNFSN